MKTLIRTTFTICSLLLLVTACSSETQTPEESLKATKQATEQPSTPPMLMRQFGGCKAHQ